MNKSAIALILFALSSSALADPTGFKISVACPQVNFQNSLTNFGSYVAGYGQESIQGGYDTGIYFKSTGKLPTNVPSDLGSYKNESVEYNSVSGQITCTYSSNNQNYAPISVSYTLTNGIGATVIQADAKSINLVLPVGLASK